MEIKLVPFATLSLISLLIKSLYVFSSLNKVINKIALEDHSYDYATGKNEDCETNNQI